MGLDIIGLGPIFDFGNKLLDKLIPDPAARDAAKIKLLELQQTGELAQLNADTDLAKAQIAVNQQEAQSDSLFKSGWRPALAWGCMAILALNALIQMAMHAYGSNPPPLVDAETAATIKEILFALVGMRGVEKIYKVAAK